MSSADAPMSLGRRLTRSQPWLDDLAERLQPRVSEAVTSRSWLHDLLDGTWLGTPLHAALTDVPVGAWSAAFALDTISALTGSPAARTAADGALAVGVAGAVPTALTGTSDWRDLTGESRRIATLHGLLNTVGLTLNVASLACRRQDKRERGRALSALALAVSGTAAHLGGELSFGLGVRVNQTFDGAQPTEFTTVSDQNHARGRRNASGDARRHRRAPRPYAVRPAVRDRQHVQPSRGTAQRRTSGGRRGDVPVARLAL